MPTSAKTSPPGWPAFCSNTRPALLKPYGIDAGYRRRPASCETIARKRGCIIKGGGGNSTSKNLAAILLTDYRSGALGRITLETPVLRAERQASLAAAASRGVETKILPAACRQKFNSGNATIAFSSELFIMRALSATPDSTGSSIAQSVERRTVNRRVPGSSPGREPKIST